MEHIVEVGDIVKAEFVDEGLVVAVTGEWVIVKELEGIDEFAMNKHVDLITILRKGPGTEPAPAEPSGPQPNGNTLKIGDAEFLGPYSVALLDDIGEIVGEIKFDEWVGGTRLQLPVNYSTLVRWIEYSDYDDNVLFNILLEPPVPVTQGTPAYIRTPNFHY